MFLVALLGVYLVWFLQITAQARQSTDPKPVFINILRSPRIDSQPAGQVRQLYLTYRQGKIHRLAESIPGLLKCLQIRALDVKGGGAVSVGHIRHVNQNFFCSKSDKQRLLKITIRLLKCSCAPLPDKRFSLRVMN